MSTANTVIVSPNYLEDLRYFIAHQPPFFGLVLVYAMLCIALALATRSKSYIIAFASGWLYLIPYVVHG